MKNVLLIMTDFYGYNNDIIAEMERQNCHVQWYQDKIQFTFLENLYSKINKKYKGNRFNQYFDEILEKEKKHSFDEVLIIFGAGFMNAFHLKKLKSTFTSARIVYYAWDSVANFPAIKSLFEGADVAYSFDKKDCAKYEVKFLPLFYVSKDVTGKKNVQWDVSTIMSFYNKKSLTLKKIMESLPSELRKFFFLRLRCKEYYHFMKIFHRKNYEFFKDYFTFDNLKRNECLDVIKKSIAVIDCPVPNQNGLTMRTFESLAMKTKLITSNINIKGYDFYTPNNIFVVEDDENKIPRSFFYEPFDEKYQISDKYSLSHFVNVLIQNCSD